MNCAARSDDDRLVAPAPAKINLTLDVLGRRPDGYHELRSVMQTLELHDTLELRRADALTFACDDLTLQGEANLVLRAAHLLRRETDTADGAAIVLRKAISVDAGLGGGSSDAAATLMALNRLWRLGLNSSRLAEIGAALGSDVPFFMYAPTALVAGRGEVVEPLSPPPVAHVVLLKPPTGVVTARVFAAFSPERYGDGTATERLLDAWRAGEPPQRWPLANDLETIVTALFPEVAQAIAALRAAGAPNVRMSGSGSTVYALCASPEEARRVYESVDHAPYRAYLTHTQTAPSHSVGFHARNHDNDTMLS